MAAICVFCSSSEVIDPAHVALAAELGTAMAERGHTLVSGGGRVSMMGAVAAAVRAGGGHTLGVIPRALLELEVADTDADDLVVTADMRERKGRMDAASDAFVTLPGGLGTLEELLEIWVSISLGIITKPLVVLDPTGILAPLRDLVDGLLAAGFVRGPAAVVPVWASDVTEALDAVEAGLLVPAHAEATADELLEAEP